MDELEREVEEALKGLSLPENEHVFLGPDDWEMLAGRIHCSCNWHGSTLEYYGSEEAAKEDWDHHVQVMARIAKREAS